MAHAQVTVQARACARALARIRAQSRRCNCRKCASLCHGTPGIYVLLAPDCCRRGLGNDGNCDSELRTVLEPWPSRLSARGCRLAQADMPLSCVAALACGKSQSADKNEAPVIWAATLGGQSSRNLRGRTVAATRRSASETQPCGRKSCRQPLRWANSSCRCPSR